MTQANEVSLRDWFASQVYAQAYEAARHITEGDLNRMFGSNKIDMRLEAIAAALAYRYADELMKRRATEGESS